MSVMLKNSYYEEIVQSLHNDHGDPHSILGLHKHPDGYKVIRLFRPGASTLYVEVKGKTVPLTRVHDAGLFEVAVNDDTSNLDYLIWHHDGSKALDPYSFWPTFGQMDLYLFSRGVHYQLYKVMGAHPSEHQGIKGVRFAVWAPNARRVSLVGDFNHWDGKVTPMRNLHSSGLWEIFVPGLDSGAKYKYEIKTADGDLLLKADPYAFFSEERPKSASIVFDVENFSWSDFSFMEKRRHTHFSNKPMNIYEVHLGSWKCDDEGNFLNYRQIAVDLAAYCREMAFTHVELTPIMEHPFDESWGYQVTGYFAATSRYGTPHDFQWFVNHLHENDIGVILDWVPGHFPTDEFSLGRFDGTALYEHEDPRKGFHPHWSTLIFNFGRHEVSNFLIANALFWFEVMHIDGLRVDAVASMLYLDYGREHGDWIPNHYGGKENLEAIEFFKHLNSVVHQKHPDILMIAEESTSFGGVTHPLEQGGLGFDLKWNMGWMNDTLRYFSTDMIFRHHHHNDLTFGLLYTFSEKFVLVLSHDEVVHGKKSLLAKMPGDTWQQFANMRLLYSYMICQPGKKLLFMGGEVGQWNEWHCKGSVEWDLLKYPIHDGLKRMIADVNHFYLKHPAFWEQDHSHHGFEWVDFGDRGNSVISYLRKGFNETVLCVHNFTPVWHDEYFIPVKNLRHFQEIFNSDATNYGGAGNHTANPEVCYDYAGEPCGIKITMAPLATMIYATGE